MWCCRRGETSLDVLQLIAPAQQHAADYVKRYTAGEEMWRTADRTAITLHTGLRCPRGMLYNEKLASPTCYAAGSPPPVRLPPHLSQTSTSLPTLPDLKLGHNVFRACRDTALAATYKESSGAGGASGSSAGVKQVGSGVGVV